MKYDIIIAVELTRAQIQREIGCPDLDEEAAAAAEALPDLQQRAEDERKADLNP